MSWYADLDTHTMVANGDHVRAVGWLSSSHPFPQGDSSPAFHARLRKFVLLAGDSADALWFPAFGGVHLCELCRGFHHGCNFGVPAGGVLYVAPAMLGHYVEEHGYAPPAEFVAAVMASPLPGTPEYRARAEPFARLRQAEWDRAVQRQIVHAGRWARERGGTDEAAWEAVRTFCGSWTPEMFERVRAAMQDAEPFSWPPSQMKTKAEGADF